jgi:hypothetical protein
VSPARLPDIWFPEAIVILPPVDKDGRLKTEKAKDTTKEKTKFEQEVREELMQLGELRVTLAGNRPRPTTSWVCSTS